MNKPLQSDPPITGHRTHRNPQPTASVLSVASLRDQLRGIDFNSDSPAILQHIAAACIASSRVDALFLLSHSDTGEPDFILLSDPSSDTPRSANEKNLQRLALESAMRCVVTDQICSESISDLNLEPDHSSDDPDQIGLRTAVPIPSSSGLGCDALVAIYSAAPSRDAEVTHMLDMTAAAIEKWRQSACTDASHQPAQQLAALTELDSRVASADSLHHAAEVLACELANYLGAESVWVGVAAQPGKPCRCIAQTDASTLDNLSQTTQAVESVMQESLLRGAIGQLPSANSSPKHALLCHQQLIDTGGANYLISCPLVQPSGGHLGSLVLAFENAPPNYCEAFLDVASSNIAATLILHQRAQRGQISQAFHSGRRCLTGSRLRVIAIGVAIVAAILCWPVTYRVDGRCQLEATSRHYVAAPFAAKLAECFVKPGSRVEKGQRLARLDGKEIQWELAHIEAELQTETKRRAGHIAAHQSADAVLATHRIEHLTAKRNLLSQRIADLVIRSPEDGIVVSGDLRRAEGIPLEKGESLFEIADLNGMIAEIDIPEDDRQFVQPGQTVEIRLDATPFESRVSKIESVHPRAEVHDSANVFVSETQLQSTDSLQLLPGMRGKARISTQSRSLGWIWFHKPIAALARLLG